METLSMKRNVRNRTALQTLTGLRAMGISRQNQEDEFDRDVNRAISGDELLNRLSTKICKLFENERTLSSGS